MELRYGLHYMLTERCHELSLIPRRLYYLYKSDHHALLPSVVERPAAILADAYYFGVLGLAVVGLRGVSSVPLARVLPFTIAFFSIVHGVLFFGEPRYHAPLVPIFAILAARGAARALATPVQG